MSKKFKQVSTGLTLVCNREDVIRQYEKYPEAYIPLDDKPEKKPETPKAKVETEKSAKDDSAKTEAKTEPATKADSPKTPEKK